MASEDIDFLFTNISVEETIDISVLFFCNLFNLVTKESCYMIKNRLYRQIDGVAVGSPLSTTMTWKKKTQVFATIGTFWWLMEIYLTNDSCRLT